MSVQDALKQAQAMGLSEEALRALCAACNVKYGAILPPISGSFAIDLSQAGIN
jgi:hypothetical protein